MKIVKLQWRNIFSYGDNITEIEFSDEGKLWQLSGKSGSGKSSLLSIPKLLLFGKTEGGDGKPVDMADVSNWLNKKGWICGTIVKNNDTYVIERTFSPSTLTITKNGAPLDKAGVKNMQGIIDTEILDNMPYNIFANVMSLSLNNFKSFISMSPADKRLIIDKIFSLEIINKVYELVRKDMKDLGNSINISNSQIYSLDQTIKTSQAELDNLNNSESTDNIKDKLDEIQQKLVKVDTLYQQQNTLYTQLYNTYNDTYKIDQQIVIAINSENFEIGNINKKINLFNQDKCPTCGTSFASDEFKNIKEDLLKQLNERQDTLASYTQKHNELLEQFNTINSQMQEVQVNIQKINDKKNELTKEYTRIEASSSISQESVAIQNIINQTNKTKSDLEKSIVDANEKMKMLEIIETMYSADGIKQTMMNNYIPTLNEEISETLNFLGFPYSLEFDNNFDPHMQYLGRSIKPKSLSIGEHKKVDLTVLCSLLKMIKRKYPQINLVCLDETVSSLDYESSTEIIKYLKEISKEMNLNIFIVSHTMLDENLFDEHILVEKNAEYSVLTRI
jgi:DNA repair exonuclease SbcCD ATPase subunit